MSDDSVGFRKAQLKLSVVALAIAFLGSADYA